MVRAGPGWASEPGPQRVAEQRLPTLGSGQHAQDLADPAGQLDRVGGEHGHRVEAPAYADQPRELVRVEDDPHPAGSDPVGPAVGDATRSMRGGSARRRRDRLQPVAPARRTAAQAPGGPGVDEHLAQVGAEHQDRRSRPPSRPPACDQVGATGPRPAPGRRPTGSRSASAAAAARPATPATSSLTRSSAISPDATRTSSEAGRSTGSTGRGPKAGAATGADQGKVGEAATGRARGEDPLRQVARRGTELVEPPEQLELLGTRHRGAGRLSSTSVRSRQVRHGSVPPPRRCSTQERAGSAVVDDDGMPGIVPRRQGAEDCRRRVARSPTSTSA